MRAGTLILASGLLLGANAQAATIKLADTELNIGGYLKLDTLVTDYEARPSSSLEPLGRDYYAGARSVPLDDGSGGVTLTDMHAKQSRLWIKTQTTLDNGDKLGTHLEVDFQNSGQGNETISNSYAPRLRQAFITYGNWLLGQAWSTFQNVGALPETLDFIGPADSTVFIRQPMIRYSQGPFAIALENPETRLSGATPDTQDDNAVPDLALRLGLGSGLTLTGLLRLLESHDDAATGGVDDTAIAGGLSLSGKFQLGRDDFKFMLTAGSGLGRYLGVIGNMDGKIDANGDIEAIDSMAAYIGYRHFWSDKTRSSLVLSAFDGDGSIAKASSVHLNLLHSPAKNMTVGIELMHAQREDASGAEGAMSRLQFSSKLAF